MKTKLLYHGSIKKIKGKYFLPKKQDDLEKKPKNMYSGVYSTSIKDIAIAMEIISCKGVYSASLNFKKRPYGKIYDGWPKQKYIYLYYFNPDNFKKSGGSGKQFVSLKKVKPIRVKRLEVKDHIFLVKKANNFEVKRFLQKHKLKLWEKKLK